MVTAARLNRRDFAAGAALFGGSLLAPSIASADLVEAPMRMPPRQVAGPKLDVAMLVYPGMVLLDLVGPQTILQILGSNIHLVAATKAPVSTVVGIPVTPTTTFAECPSALDVLFVPGGLMGTIASMGDD
jgi:cyclohexyl-isocyanide hydratase